MIKRVLNVSSLCLVMALGVSGCGSSGDSGTPAPVGNSDTPGNSSNTPDSTPNTSEPGNGENTEQPGNGNPPGGETPDPDTTPVSNPSTPGEDTFSDEFDVDSLSSWMRRHQVEGTTAQYTQLDINTTNVGSLTIVPTETPGWFRDGDAPLIFKEVTGDFSVETEVLAERLSGDGLPPTEQFNSAGLMARNPAGGSGPENYIMINVGTQDSRIQGSVGSEIKTTVNSDSVLDLQVGTNRGRLILCRIGDDFIGYRLLDNETEWTELATLPRPDLPDTLQVGMVVNAFNAADVRAVFGYVRLRGVEGGCLP